MKFWCWARLNREGSFSLPYFVEPNIKWDSSKYMSSIIQNSFPYMLFVVSFVVSLVSEVFFPESFFS